MKKLVRHILDDDNKQQKQKKQKRIKLILADGAYDSNKNFKFLNEKRIQSAIKAKRNSTASSKNTITRNKKKLFIKQKISLNGKRKEDMDKDG
jgi:hypothetical protein